MAEPAMSRVPDYGRITAIALAVLLLARLAAILASGVDLYADEAQYWRWSTDPAWGYYSKPPLIAWVIGLATALAGHGEWAIRLPAPILHTLAASALYLLGRDMDGARTGMFAALGYALMPGVIVSSAVISTDGVLLPFWCLALWLFWRMRQGQAGWAGALGFGLCLGAGFLAKYAMIYFAIGLAITAVIDAPTRRALFSARGAVAILLAAALFGPHMAWNAANDFKTVGHTVDNARLGGELFNPGNLGKFLIDQMGVFGPIGFLVLLFGLVPMLRARSGEGLRRNLWLLAFILPVILIIAFQSVLSRAHANWAATAYPAASVLVAIWLVHARRRPGLWWAIAGLTALAIQFIPDIAFLFKQVLALGIAGAILLVGLGFRYRPAGLLWTAIGVHATLALLLAALVASPPGVTTALGLDNGFKRVRGWEQTAASVRAMAQEIDASAILVDERELWHGLDYYMRGERPAPLIAWRRKAGIHSFSERRELTDGIDENVLVASYRPNHRARMRGDFEAFDYLGEAEIPLGLRANGCPITRRLVFYRASGHAPKTRDRDWEERYEGQVERPARECPDS
ncbi:MAG: phospholipid carrier-dependent glycosyltransferase [Alphaproteobacteria bacterium]|jgi:4-amino-4-deoxy-L-arabinose transferase-like glycosyltransferase|nr:phospholipid carrier-dependent glycosyltransferase [Alphaproteobacteria bacterium]